MSNVLVSVTIGIGDVIHSEKASARDVSCGLTSAFIFFDVCDGLKIKVAGCLLYNAWGMFE